MKLAHLIDKRLILLDSPASTLDEATRAGIAAMSEHHRGEADFEAALARVRERTALGGTVMPSGIAVPHARLETFKDFLIAAVVPRNPIAIPNAAPVHLVWVILAPLSSSDLYLKVLASVVALSKSAASMEALRRAPTAAAFLETIDEAGYELEKGLVVSDIMTRDVVTIREDESVKSLIDLMYSHRFRYVPVLDAEGGLVGEVSILDLIAAGVPDYAQRVGNLKFLSELAPLEDFLRNEVSIPVKKVMKKPFHTVTPDTPVIDAAAEMAKSRKRHFPVIEGGKVVGVISSMDILVKVLRA